MSRKPRIHYPGAVYHVILRGNAGDQIFFEDPDRYRLFLILQHAVEKFDCRIHGFCFMTNHVHIVMQTGAIPLSRIMQNISLRYTKWINITRSRTGHLFQGRYNALLLDADEYLLELVRYVHLNPVRAGVVAVPEEYPWSGHHAFLGTFTLPWLTTDWVLSQFSGTIKEARKGYSSFVSDGLREKRRNEFHSGNREGRILGDDTFAEHALVQAEQQLRRGYTLSEAISSVCRVYGISEEQLKAPGKARPFTEARALIAVLVREAPDLSLTELGKAVNREIAPLARAAQRLMDQAAGDAHLMSLIEGIRSAL
jgi:REP element-mobilizing transposase RayT